jgi:hypothetical protein
MYVSDPDICEGVGGPTSADKFDFIPPACRPPLPQACYLQLQEAPRGLPIASSEYVGLSSMEWTYRKASLHKHSMS